MHTKYETINKKIKPVVVPFPPKAREFKKKEE